jgi:hypothetical protein
MTRILCWLGLHDWMHFQTWEPSFHAPIVTRAYFESRCRRCGKSDVCDARFDPVTGAPTTINGMPA